MVTAYSLLIFSTIVGAQTPEWEEEFPGQKGSLPQRLRHSPRGFGVGIFTGAPVGPIALDLSYKWKKSMQQLALAGGTQDGNIRLKFDQLWQVHVIPSDEYLYFPIFAGLGISGRLNERRDEMTIIEEDYINIRVPLTMSSNSENIAIDLYAEVAPSLLVVPRVQFDVEWGFGSRIYFF